MKPKALEGSSQAWLFEILDYPNKNSASRAETNARKEQAKQQKVNNATHAGTNALVAAFNCGYPGFLPLGRAVVSFLGSIMDGRDPAK